MKVSPGSTSGRRAFHQRVGRCCHRLEGGERLTARDPDLRERVSRSAPQLYRLAGVALDRESTVATEVVPVIERSPPDRRRLARFGHDIAGGDTTRVEGEVPHGAADGDASDREASPADAGTDANRTRPAPPDARSERPSCQYRARGHARSR